MKEFFTTYSGDAPQKLCYDQYLFNRMEIYGYQSFTSGAPLPNTDTVRIGREATNNLGVAIGAGSSYTITLPDNQRDDVRNWVFSGVLESGASGAAVPDGVWGLLY